ncbi:MAG: DUF1501 domain-containing protein [Cyclobacteriaceae bacterium]
MKRRNFIKNISAAAGVPLALNGIPIKVMASQTPMERLVAQSDNDKVLIILQMHGGNDGINTFVPIDQYDQYYNRRANIALPYKSGNRSIIELDSTLAIQDQVGLHPDLMEMKRLYDRGRMSVVQGVSYPKNNGSHFRGRDIWFMGGGPDDYFSSGWVGRYLSHEYKPLSYPDDFPNENMKDPLALEMGNDVSLLFHQGDNIPVSLSLNSNPGNLARLIEQLEGFVDEGIDPRGLPPEFLKGTRYEREMDWILSLEDKSETYVSRLLEVYNNASATTIDYPEVYPFATRSKNPLSGQLQLVARLLDGGGPGKGVKTKVFLVKIGGFDTHAEQVQSGDPTVGSHSALLYHISTAMSAFQKDLKARGIEEKVLTMTMSEFGRRVASNGSFGTDHGTGGPVMLFGQNVKPGVFGTNPDMAEKNVAMQYDYRQLYANILKDWMEVDESVINNEIFFKNFIDGTDEDGDAYEPLELTRSVISGTNEFISQRFRLESPFPNPAHDFTNIKFRINTPDEVSLSLLNVAGKTIRHIGTKQYLAGDHQLRLDLKDLSAGIYTISVKSVNLNASKKLIVRK